MAPQIFTRARDSVRLVSAHHNRGRVGGPPTNFKGEHLKFRLIFSAFTPIRASDNNLMKLYQATCREVAVITRVQLLERVPQQNLGGPKT